jgi:HD-GYP domain-containing protein (c-di-GMP phosphodiesterase class II)
MATLHRIPIAALVRVLRIIYDPHDCIATADARRGIDRMSSFKQSPPAARSCKLPSAFYFEGDALACAAVRECARFPYCSFESSEPGRLDGENVFVVAEEQLFAEHLKRLRVPNVRVIALSDERFRDVRLDSTVYAYLPATTSVALLERMFDNAIDHMHLVQTRREANDKLALANSEIYELNHIGAALSAEHDTRELLELILTKCREITRADAGSVYLVEEEEPRDRRRGVRENRAPGKYLRFKLAQNDTVAVPFGEVVLPIDETSIAGYVAKHGSVVMIEDAYELESWVPYSINKRFDIDSGYRTKSILAVAMMNPKNEIVGVVQLINAKRNWRARLHTPEDMESEVLPFSTRQMEIVSSLASQATVAYENSHLYENIHRLFEGFVKASIGAIEQRDPTASGHSFRVANLTVAMAEAVDRDQTHFRDVKFTRSEMKEIRYASLLHDFGKVGVREEVLIKARKLHPEQMEALRRRFDFARRTLQAESCERKLAYLLEKDREEFLRELPRFDRELAKQLDELDCFAEFIHASNQPSVVPEGTFEMFREMAGKQYRSWDGTVCPLVTAEEVRLLSIPQGSLDESERQEVESHVDRTYEFLKQIPWTREIRNIPELARGHHEKLNGHGYPGRLAAMEIPLPTRLMTIADIFDALAAADRPYKESVSVERALEILGQMAANGEIDSQAYTLFVQAKVYERWKVDCFEY